MNDVTTVYELLQWVLDHKDDIYVRAKVNGHYETVRLSDLNDERQIALFVTGWLEKLTKSLQHA